MRSAGALLTAAACGDGISITGDCSIVCFLVAVTWLMVGSSQGSHGVSVTSHVGEAAAESDRYFDLPNVPFCLQSARNHSWKCEGEGSRMTPTDGNGDGTSNGMADAGPAAEQSLTSEQKAQDILASARAEADAILNRARAAAAEVSGGTAQREGRSAAAVASEQVLAKARAAASEIRAKAAGLTGDVQDKVHASADAVLEYARSTAREFREQGPKTTAEAVAWARSVEEQILSQGSHNGGRNPRTPEQDRAGYRSDDTCPSPPGWGIGSPCADAGA